MISQHNYDSQNKLLILTLIENCELIVTKCRHMKQYKNKLLIKNLKFY